eukprot:14685424-Alexandrium_andersonii.AAC.1
MSCLPNQPQGSIRPAARKQRAPGSSSTSWSPDRRHVADVVTAGVRHCAPRPTPPWPPQAGDW